MEKKYTIAEAAKLSGMSESWWRLQIREKRVRYFMVGAKRYFIPESTIENLQTTIEPTND